MKKLLLSAIAICLLSYAGAQDILTGWTFPTGTDTDLNANQGTEQNMGYDIRMIIDEEGTAGTTSFTKGAEGEGDYAVTAEGWDNGANLKYWSIKFKAPEYKNFVVTAKQRTGGNKPGPRDWKIQYKTSGQSDWIDIENGNITLGNDWETGLTNVQLPAECNNPEKSIHLRWIMTSNTSLTGEDVAPTGICKIDDIQVTGEKENGIQTVLFNQYANIYPNPSNGIFTIESEKNISQLHILNMNGTLVFKQNNAGRFQQINLSQLSKGIYFIQVLMDNKMACQKIMIQ